MEDISVSHLQFADDTLFFLENSLENVSYVDAILKLFCACSGLKINMGRSTIVSINVHQSVVQGLAVNLGCEVGECPPKYLGLPVGGNMNTMDFGCQSKKSFQNS